MFERIFKYQEDKIKWSSSKMMMRRVYKILLEK
jgi:hypothetical protein